MTTPNPDTTKPDPDALRMRLLELMGWKHYGCTGCSCTPCVCNEWIHESGDGILSAPLTAHAEALCRAVESKS